MPGSFHIVPIAVVPTCPAGPIDPPTNVSVAISPCAALGFSVETYSRDPERGMKPCQVKGCFVLQ